MKHLITIMFCFSAYSQAQNAFEISGVVTSNGLPLPFANVYLESTTKGTTTSSNGSFTIQNITEGQYTLTASYTGFNTFKKRIEVIDDLKINFELIQNQSNTSWHEMYKVFNCGHRMELYVNPDIANRIIDISKSFNIDAKIIGRVEKSSEKKLTISSKYGEFIYK